MKVAVQGCSHGSLDEIYRTVKSYTETTKETVDLLLLCGDFQALRSKHDFASLAVPPKYFSLGSFHEYYSGKRVAPVLTLVIGGNHEASNYMWELYHGGWLAPNIYYLGNSGCVQVDGLRIVGMSGIYKSNDYHKGHFETMPLDRSTMRSIYHIRQYDVMKVKLLSVTSPTITLSHDWPCSIYYHGDTKRLIRNKPFFEKEIQTDTLGSPPLLEVLKVLKPDYWFSAHLHVKFAAVYDHNDGYMRPVEDWERIPSSTTSDGKTGPNATTTPVPVNPDEITIGDDDDEEADIGTPAVVAPPNPDEIQFDDEDDVGEGGSGRQSAEPESPTIGTKTDNPDEITFEDDDEAGPTEEIVFKPESGAETAATMAHPEVPTAEEARQALKIDESVDLVEAVRKEEGVVSTSTKTIAVGEDQKPVAQSEVDGPVEPKLSGPSRSTGRQTKFLALDKVLPGRDFIQFLDIPTPKPTVNHQPVMTFDPHWLAITRVMHPFLSLSVRQLDPPYGQLEEMINTELETIKSQGLLVPEIPKEGEEIPVPTLVWEKGPIEVGRVQKFWPTAPAHGTPGGSDHAWYTNPQTEAFCGMLGIENKINPSPKA